jgi:hypothetical protein
LSGPVPQPPASSALAPTAKPASSPAPPSPVNCHSACPDPVGERSDERPTSGASPESYREEPASSSNSSLATHHSFTPSAAEGPLPQPHTPLPPTSAEFAQQVLAGLNSSRSEIKTPSGPGQKTGASGSSSSSTSPAAPQPPANCHSACPDPVGERGDERPTSGASPESYREEPASSSNSSLATHHSFTPSAAEGPLPQPVPAPLPPGFGAPANWDVLLTPKPRRRFSRHWHLLK